jgi:RNA polymerase sigma-70 factor (ECF subfamily)
MNKDKQLRAEDLLDDEEIIDLYWVRNERAIVETDRKYKRYLFSIAYNILHDMLDCEECLNDTYLGTWNAIPPTRPSIFQVFLSKIMRNTATVRYRHNTASKRIPTEMKISLDEISECFAYTESAEEAYLISELSRIVSDFLRSLPEKRAFIFICRYYCCDTVPRIAKMIGMSESTVFRELATIREQLMALLKKEGYYND